MLHHICERAPPAFLISESSVSTAVRWRPSRSSRCWPALPAPPRPASTPQRSRTGPRRCAPIIQPYARRLLLGSVYSFTDDQRAPSHWPLRPAAVQHVPIDRCHALQHLRTAGLEVLLAVWNRGRGLVAHEGCLVRTSLPWLAAVLHVGSATLGSAAGGTL